MTFSTDIAKGKPFESCTYVLCAFTDAEYIFLERLNGLQRCKERKKSAENQTPGAQQKQLHVVLRLCEMQDQNVIGTVKLNVD